MYQFSNKLKIASIVLMAIGVVGVTAGFLSTPATPEEAMAKVSSHHSDGHGATVGNANHKEQATDNHKSTNDHSEKSHAEHLMHQLKNRPWAALYVGAFFFMMLSLGVLAFYAVQRASQAGWSPLVYRVMEGITAYLVPGGIIVFLILVMSSLHWNHLFVWMDAETVAHDPLLQGKKGYLNVPWFLIRAALFLIGWIGYREISRRLSIRQDTAEDKKYFIKNFKWSVVFLVFFLYSESVMSWDWIMSLDPHWFSTLFGWYLFASMFVSGITVIALITIYLKSRGYLEQVNNSHIHDLAKFMFGISIFWTYLWFSQFLLIWYANIPEEVTYFVSRIEDYKLPFFGMVVLNFIFPLLVLMNSDYKRLNWFVVMTGIAILVGHYLDIFNMIMPATVGDQWNIGVPEISSIFLFAGLFIFVVFRSLTKAPLIPKRNPFIEESKNFHY